MSGRQSFRKFKRIILLMVGLINLTPLFFRRFLWGMSTNFGGKMAVALRYVLLKSMAKEVGDNVYLGRFVTIKNPQNLSVGSNVSIHEYCYIDAVSSIEIGSHVSIAHSTSILSADHSWSDITVDIKYNEEIHKPTKIEDDVWIGCGVRILGGVRVSSRSVVAAGAVVSRNVGNNTLVGGVPAKEIKKI